jgi:hypothetical protein
MPLHEPSRELSLEESVDLGLPSVIPRVFAHGFLLSRIEC